MAEDADILDSWEELDDKDVLDKQLKGITLNDAKEEKSNDFSNNSPAIIQEDGIRTQYAPQVRILKRECDQNSELLNKAKNTPQPQKSLEQREAEYKEARLRIMGSAYEVADENTNNNASLTGSTEQRPVRLVQHVEEMRILKADNSIKLLREPRGPDGSPGFDMKR